MRLLIKLVIAALVAHAAYRAGMAYWVYYKFHDGLQEVAQFGQDHSDQELQSRAMAVAMTLQVPIESEQIAIRREPSHTFIDASYKTDIEILPTYRYPWEFKVNVDALSFSVPNKAGDLVPAK